MISATPLTKNISIVQQQLLELRQQSVRHKNANLGQLTCLIVIVSVGLITVRIVPANQLKTWSFLWRQGQSHVLLMSLMLIAIMAFAISWWCWFSDLKYRPLEAQFTELHDNHAEMIKASPTLAAIAADYQRQFDLAILLNGIATAIAFAVIAGIGLRLILPA